MVALTPAAKQEVGRERNFARCDDKYLTSARERNPDYNFDGCGGKKAQS